MQILPLYLEEIGYLVSVFFDTLSTSKQIQIQLQVSFINVE